MYNPIGSNVLITLINVENKERRKSDTPTPVVHPHPTPPPFPLCSHFNVLAEPIPGLRPANERRRYIVRTSLIGWAQT